MRKYILLFLFFSQGAFGQMNFTPGMQWQGGMSKIRLVGDPVLAPDGSEFRFDPGFCFGIAMGGDLNLKNERGGFSSSLCVQQLRSRFKYYSDVTPPRYELNYVDLNVKLFYRGQKPEARTKEFIGFGFTTSYLFSAWRVYNTGADIITDDFYTMNYGFQFEVGMERRLKRNDFLRITLNNCVGLRQIFSGGTNTMEAEGKTGSSQLSVYYILGKRKQE